MAIIPGTIIIDPVTVGDTTANKFGTHFAFMGVGGAIEVWDTTDLHTIPVNPTAGTLNLGDPYSSGRRRLGMIVYVIQDNKFYKLIDPIWNTYTTDQERYNSLSNNNNWKDAMSDLYLPIAGGNMNGPIGLVDGTISNLAIRFKDNFDTGFFYNSNGLNILTRGQQYTLSPFGLDMINSNNASMRVGEGNVTSNQYSNVFGSYSEATAFVTTAVGTVVKAQNQYATIVGSFSDNAALHGTLVGLLSHLSGYRGTVVGNNITVSGSYGAGFGSIINNQAPYASLMGNNLEALAGAAFAVVMGTFLSSQSARTTIIGTGINDTFKLINNIPNSIMLGSNSDKPSLFVNGGDGTSGSLGNIGINNTNPAARLDILEGNAQVAPLRIRKSTVNKTIPEPGDVQFNSNGRLQFCLSGITMEDFAFLSDINYKSTGNAYTKIFASVQTTNSTLTDLVPSIPGQLNIASGRVWGFTFKLFAKQTGGSAGTIGDASLFQANGMIKNLGGTTVLDGALKERLQADLNTMSWNIFIIADNGNHALEIQVLGEDNKTIQWFAVIEIYEAT